MTNTHDLMQGVDSRTVAIEHGTWVINGNRYSFHWDEATIDSRQKELIEAWKDLEAIRRKIKSPEQVELIEAYRRAYGSATSVPSQEFIDGYMTAKKILTPVVDENPVEEDIP